MKKVYKRISSSIKVASLASILFSCGFDPWSSSTVSSDEELAPLAQPDPFTLTGGMERFSNCSDAEESLKSQMIRASNLSVDRNLNWALESKRYQKNGYSKVAAMSESRVQNDDILESSSVSSDEGPTNHTETNNQVSGVEEADIVKNDGKHIYHLAKNKLQIIKSWPANEMKHLTSMKLNGSIKEMLLMGNKIILIGSPSKEKLPKNLPMTSSTSKIMIDPVYEPGFQNYDNRYTKVQIVDVSDRSKPVLEETYTLKGSYSEIRRIDSSLHLVLNDYLKLPGTNLGWEFENKSSSEDLSKAYQNLKKENEAFIKSQTIEQILSMDEFVKVTGGKKKAVGDLRDCVDVHVPTASTKLNLSRVATIDIDAGTLNLTAVFAEIDELYASKKSLYLATSYYWWDDEQSNTDYTFLHKFDLSENGEASYLGSGGIPGTLLNQFSMDEHNDVLRVATTIDQIRPERRTFSRVSTMGLVGDRLMVLGQTRNLAENERIYSARFYGDKGFLVTFVQVDPLFTLDLRDPLNPKVVGELKIPGFSNYMQRIDDDHILAIGANGDWNGRMDGNKISVFDVSDMANPVETHKYIFDGYTQAQSNHQAFTYFPAKKVLGIPVYDYSYNGQQDSFIYVLDINVDEGISELGTVKLRGDTACERPSYGWWSDGYNLRSIFADDFIYSVSDYGINVSTLADLSTNIAGVGYQSSCEK